MTKQISLKDVYEAVENLRNEVRDTYVTKGEFTPVRAIAYGLMGLIGTAVGAALLATVIQAK